MSDRLEEIKSRYDYHYLIDDLFYEVVLYNRRLPLVKDFAWLIDELEIARNKLRIKEDNSTMLEMRLAQTETEVERLNEILKER